MLSGVTVGIVTGEDGGGQPVCWGRTSASSAEMENLMLRVVLAGLTFLCLSFPFMTERHAWWHSLIMSRA